MLDGDAVFFGDIEQPPDDNRVVAGAVRHARAAAELDLAVLPLVDSGRVGGVGDVEDDADIRVEPVRRHLRAVSADLFLHRVDGQERGVERLAPLAQVGQHLRENEAADAVIQGAAHEMARAEHLRLVAVNRRVPDAQPERGDALRAGRADIDVKLMHLGRFLFLGVFAEMDGGVADDAAHRPFFPEDFQPPPARRGGVGAADPVDAQEPLAGDLLDDEPDLVGVRFEHDPLAPRLAGQRGPGGAVGVVLHLVREGADILHPFALPGDFEPGGAGGVEQVDEKGFCALVHRQGNLPRNRAACQPKSGRASPPARSISPLSSRRPAIRRVEPGGKRVAGAEEARQRIERGAGERPFLPPQPALEIDGQP